MLKGQIEEVLEQKKTLEIQINWEIKSKAGWGNLKTHILSVFHIDIMKLYRLLPELKFAFDLSSSLFFSKPSSFYHKSLPLCPGPEGLSAWGKD